MPQTEFTERTMATLTQTEIDSLSKEGATVFRLGSAGRSPTSKGPEHFFAEVCSPRPKDDKPIPRRATVF